MPDPSTKVQRDLFVGNMPAGMKADLLKQLFNKMMLLSGLSLGPGDPVINTRLNNKFAFIEFRSIEEASNGLQMDKFKLLGQTLSFTRPRAYQGPPDNVTADWPALVAANPALDCNAIVSQIPGMKMISEVVGCVDPATKVNRELFVGNLPPMALTEPQLHQFLNSAMVQTGMNTKGGDPIIATRLCEKFAFIELRSEQEATNAQHLNGIEVMGTCLKVTRPRPYQGTEAFEGSWQMLVAAGGMQNGVAPASMGMGSIGGMPVGMGMDMGGGVPPGAGVGGAPASPPTRVVRLSNMVTEQELADDEEYNEILEDTTSECSKYGSVVSCVIPRPGAGAAGVGFVFVEFSTPAGALSTANALGGRTFSGRTVAATFFDEEKFQQKQLE